MNPQVSIIIPARNEAKNIGRCLDAIKRQETARPFEVIVVDSGSTDGTADIAAGYGAHVIHIPAHEFDHGRTRNLGLMNSKGEYLITLVADAAPADGNWLEALIAPLEADPKVAGAYSRQVPPDDAHPLESHRLSTRFTARNEPIVSKWPGDAEWEAMAPERRMFLANFDDVSAVRRRSVWEKIPIAENYWGEDVDWSLKALKAGYRIVFAPESAVLHAHRPAILHAFRRAYVDQAVVKNLFGVVYYANMSEFLAGLRELILHDDAILKSSKMSAGERLKWRLVNPFRRLMETAGAFLAASASSFNELAMADIPVCQSSWRTGMSAPQTVKLYRSLCVFPSATKYNGRILRTTFTINGIRRNVLFAHPPATVRFKLHTPPNARIEFYPAINPDVWDKAGPVKFEVKVNGLKEYEEIIHPLSLPEQRSWNLKTIDLSHWVGKRVNIEFITRAENTDNAWAGWGEPRIMASVESFSTGLKRKTLEWLDKTVYHKPLRHP
jgi:rhamnosyltransferase